jgi:phosphatidylglycerol:prolipoprotein diacylglycerol transferase
MVFPGAPGGLPRHPSQLYEAVLEGLVIFCVLWVLSRRKRADGLIIGTLLTLYWAFRTFIEFFREPDAQLGFILGPFTMGQLLSLPLLLVGVWLVWRALAVERATAASSGEAGRTAGTLEDDVEDADEPSESD